MTPTVIGLVSRAAGAGSIDAVNPTDDIRRRPRHAAGAAKAPTLLRPYGEKALLSLLIGIYILHKFVRRLHDLADFIRYLTRIDRLQVIMISHGHFLAQYLERAQAAPDHQPTQAQ